MSEDKHESLSAFIDGEISANAGSRLLDEVLADESLTRRWASYHIIGDVMRRHMHVGTEPGAATQSTTSSNVHPFTPRRFGLGPVGGLALAASVAVVAILGIHSLNPPETAPLQTVALGTAVSSAASPPANAGSSVESRALSGAPVRRVTTTTSALPGQATRLNWNDAAPAVATRLNGYLVTHNEYIANGMRGMHPYARIVAYDGRGN